MQILEVLDVLYDWDVIYNSDSNQSIARVSAATAVLERPAVVRVPEPPIPPPEPVPPPTPWALIASGVLTVSGVAYVTTEYMDSGPRADAVLAQDIDTLARIADKIRISPELSDDVDGERQQRTAAMSCMETISLTEVEAALSVALDANGFDGDGNHACELIDVFFPGSSWTTGGGTGTTYPTFEATGVDAAAIANGAPMVLTRYLDGHDRGWYSDVCSSDYPNTSCDEYPFASTFEGGEDNYFDANHEPTGRVRVTEITHSHNTHEGNALVSFYQPSNGCSRDYDGAVFAVVPMPTSVAPPTTWSCKQ
jgi:hypothetical protein